MFRRRVKIYKGFEIETYGPEWFMFTYKDGRQCENKWSTVEEVEKVIDGVVTEESRGVNDEH